MVATDLDGDGKKDVVAVASSQNPNATSLYVFKNQSVLLAVPLIIGTTHGGNSGSVSLSVFYSALQTATTVKLVGSDGSVIPGTNLSISPTNSHLLLATFNLVGATPGVYDLVLTNPDGSSVTLRVAFTVEIGPSMARPVVELIGRSVIRAGQSQLYVLTISNMDDIDAKYVPVYVAFPDFVDYSPNTVTPVVATQVDGLTTLASEFTIIPAHSSLVVPIIVRASDDPQFAHLSFEFYFWTVNIPDSVDNSMNTISSNGRLSLFNQATGEPTSFRGWHEALDYIGELGADVLPHLVEFPGDVIADIGLHLPVFLLCGMIDVIALEQNKLGANDALNEIDLNTDARYQKLGQVKEKLQIAAGHAGLVCGIPPSDSQTKTTEIITSGDPNDKVGNVGFGPEHFVSGNQLLHYSIYFDNQPTATAAAQTVVVTDQLDKTRVDFSGLVLGPISFATHLITPPAIPLSSLGTFNTNVDLRPAQNLITRVSASLNVSTGVLTWKFQSIDPMTNQPTDDPVAGFLPPGAEGSVSFMLRPQSNLPTSRVIPNQAIIVFDVNGSSDHTVQGLTKPNLGN